MELNKKSTAWKKVLTWVLTMAMVITFIPNFTEVAKAETAKFTIEYVDENSQTHTYSISDTQWSELLGDSNKAIGNTNYSYQTKKLDAVFETLTIGGIKIEALLEQAFTSWDLTFNKSTMSEYSTNIGLNIGELLGDRYCYVKNEGDTYAKGSAVPAILYEPSAGSISSAVGMTGTDTAYDKNGSYWQSGITSITVTCPKAGPVIESGYEGADVSWYVGHEDDSSYTITTEAQLLGLAAVVNGQAKKDGTAIVSDFSGKTIKLGTDIAFSTITNMVPIGGGAQLDDATPTYKFKGIFDGNGKTISNMAVAVSSSYAGLFGYNGGTIKALTLVGAVTCTSNTTTGDPSSDFVGGIAGFNAGTIQNVISKVTVTAPYSGNVGGIAGFNTSGNWKDVDGNTNHTISDAVGLITECGNEGFIKSYKKIGGITGENEGSITKCYNKGNVYSSFTSGGNGQGGITGRNGCNNTEWGIGYIANCYNTGAINTKALENNNYWDSRYIGGISGFSSTSSRIVNCYTTGTIYQGYKDYYPVSARMDNAAKNVVNCYSLNTIIGYDSPSSNFTSYYGVRKAGADMKTAAFVSEIGGAFVADNTVNINDGYPLLRWQSDNPDIKEVTVSKIEMTSSPSKTEYFEGINFDATGMKIVATLSDNSTITLSDKDYTLSNTGALTPADTKMTVSGSYEGKEFSFDIILSIIEKELASAKIATSSPKLIYSDGEAFDSTGIKLVATYNNGKSETLTEGIKILAPEKITKLDRTVAVSYEYKGKKASDSFNLIVCEKGTKPQQDEDETYLISSADELIWFSNQVSYLKQTALNAKLTADIDTTGTNFDPIGSNFTANYKSVNGATLYVPTNNQYTGTFDGNGKTVKLALDSANYTVNATGYTSAPAYAAMFGVINGATVKNLTVDGTVKGTTITGGIVATDNSTGTIENCVNKADITGTSSSGGIIGSGKNNTIVKNCMNAGTITATGNRVGGIIGSGGKTIEGCENSGTVKASSFFVGGIVGDNNTVNGVISKCSNSGTVEGTYGVGGIAGTGYLKSISDCYNEGSIKATALTATNGAGGILGSKASSYALELANCYNAGTIESSNGVNNTVGQLIGYVNGNATKGAALNNCYSLNGAGNDNGTVKAGVTVTGTSTVKTSAEMTTQAFVDSLNNDRTGESAVWALQGSKAVLLWQKVAEDTAAAQDVIDAIDGIGTVENNDQCKDKIVNAETKYALLTVDQKAYVANYSVLTAARASYDKLVIDYAAAKDVDDKIGAIGTVTESSNVDIAAARSTYDILTQDQKNLVTKYQTLLDAEKAYKEIEDNKAAAKAVTDAIKLLPSPVTLKDKSDVEAARAGYKALNSKAKTYVDGTTVDELTAAESKIAELMVPVNQVAVDIADVVKSPVTGSDEDIKNVMEALKSYEALPTNEAKKLVANYDKLVQARNTIAAINHTSSGVTVEGAQLPWYVKVSVTPVLEGEDFNKMKEEASGQKEFLAMFDIVLTEYKFENNELVTVEYDAAGKQVTVRIKDSRFINYEKAVVLHQNEDGSYNRINGEISGDVLSFVTELGFSNYGVTAEKKAISGVKTGDDSNMLLFMLIMITAAIIAAGTLTYRRRVR